MPKRSVTLLRNTHQLIVKQLDYDLTPVAGLALVGHYLKYVFSLPPSARRTPRCQAMRECRVNFRL